MLKNNKSNKINKLKELVPLGVAAVGVGKLKKTIIRKFHTTKQACYVDGFLEKI